MPLLLLLLPLKLLLAVVVLRFRVVVLLMPLVAVWVVKLWLVVLRSLPAGLV